MSIEIKTATVEPIRQTFSHTRRRFGDKPASRYQEASFDIEATTNFHYRPLWQPGRLLNDPARTCLRMADWYAVIDPRQFYYGTYVQTRARMQETTEHEFAFSRAVEMRQQPESVWLGTVAGYYNVSGGTAKGHRRLPPIGDEDEKKKDKEVDGAAPACISFGANGIEVP